MTLVTGQIAASRCMAVRPPTRSRAAAGGLLLALLATLLTAVSANPAQAADPPPFQLPFTCGQTWRLETSGDHVPALDMFRDPDQSTTEGSLLVASADGEVVESRLHPNAGHMIQIDHGDRWFTTYIHLQSRAVEVGTTVTQGQTIGRVGHTGETSNGVPHLHYELLSTLTATVAPPGEGRAPSGSRPSSTASSTPDRRTSATCAATTARRWWVGRRTSRVMGGRI